MPYYSECQLEECYTHDVARDSMTFIFVLVIPRAIRLGYDICGVAKPGFKLKATVAFVLLVLNRVGIQISQGIELFFSRRIVVSQATISRLKFSRWSLEEEFIGMESVPVVIRLGLNFSTVTRPLSHCRVG